MTMGERLKLHRAIEQENSRRYKEFIRELNERIAAEEVQKLVDAGIIAG